MFEHQTIAELARVAERVVRRATEEGPVAGPVPLTPVQQAYLAQGLAHPEHYNQSLLLATAPEIGRLDAVALRSALAFVLAHHDALRLRFVAPGVGEPAWRQVNEPPGMEPPL